MRSTLQISCICFWVASVAPLSTARAHEALEQPQKPKAAAQQRTEPKKSPPDARKLEDWGEHRVMGGHAFPFATFVDTPFAASYVGVTGGLEYHRVPNVAEPLAFLGDSGSKRVDLQTLNVAETLDFAIRLQSLFALFGSVYGRARIGVDAPTLLGNGADYRYGGEVGPLFRLLRVGDFQLALRARGGAYAGQQAGITGLFHDLGNIVNDAFARIQANPMLDLNSTLATVNAAFASATQELLVPFYGYRYGGSVNAAQALGRYVGVQLALGVMGETTYFQPRVYDAITGSAVVRQQQATSLAGRGALALDLDGAPAGLPLDLLLEYALTLGSVQTTGPNESSNTSSTEHLIALGLFYSGRPDLQLGASVYGLLGQVPVVAADRTLSGHPLDVGTLFVFRYIW